MTKDELNKLIADAGVGSRTAKKLHEALDRQVESPRPRTSSAGHGSATVDQSPLSTM